MADSVAETTTGADSDKFDDCANWRNLCNEVDKKEWMYENCPVTCSGAPPATYNRAVPPVKPPAKIKRNLTPLDGPQEIPEWLEVCT